MTFTYDRASDTLYIDRVPVYEAQASDEIEDGIVVRTNPKTGQVENWEVMFISSRLAQGTFQVPEVLPQERV